MINIHRFYDPDDFREYMNRPAVIGDHTFACNGHIILIQPATPEFSPPECHIPNNITDVIDRILSHPYQPATERPALPEKCECKTCNGTGKSTQQKCDECGGSGEVELWSGKHEYECECKSCQGDGRTVQPGGDHDCLDCNGTKEIFKGNHRYAHVLWSGMHIAARYAELIINEPELQIYVDDEKGMFSFKCGEQYGAIMKLCI